MSIRWTRTSVRSFVWNLTRSLFHFTSLFKFPVARVVGAKPTPAEPRATPANAPKTAAPTIAAINFFLKRNTRTGPPPLISIACRRVSHTPCNVRRKDSSKPLVVLGMLDSAGGRASSQSSYPRPPDRESGAHLVPTASPSSRKVEQHHELEDPLPADPCP